MPPGAGEGGIRPRAKWAKARTRPKDGSHGDINIPPNIPHPCGKWYLSRPHHPQQLNESGGHAQGKREWRGHKQRARKERSEEREKPLPSGFFQEATWSHGDAPSPPSAAGAAEATGGQCRPRCPGADALVRPWSFWALPLHTARLTPRDR